ncbi:DUF502 domain-containing protein [Dehalococcoides mccartyi]|uniref:DUF502 domain-containing protein n=1 Tax=Dehalococcoides mccartyi TaxID=61435 RepID=A0AB38Z807_9CHLR|nr:DUF502 domain-containing protein [Dehalococcoides mccartyi]WRO06691.1 DUF502 domain-containing protein [Dehalococcoides mccartyi]
MKNLKVLRDWLGRKLIKQFITGIITVVPFGATILILIWIFNAIDSILQPVITAICGHTVTGVGFGVTIALIFLTGVVASNVIGKYLVRYIESASSSIPIVSLLYKGIKEILESIFIPGKTGFLEVVLVEFPRKGINALGFVTSEIYDENGKKMYSVFIPATPNPTTGSLQIIGEEEIIRTNISVEDAIKMVVSAGKASPKTILFNEKKVSQQERAAVK